MKVTGFTLIRNGVQFDYPFLESIQSLLPLCDQVIIAVGQSEDATLEYLHSLPAPQVQIVETIWNDSLRKGGSILAQQTNIALSQTSGDWAIYLQADEILHEDDYPIIRESMERYKDDREVEGLLFHYKHFYGSYDYIGDSRRWYRHEIRIVRPNRSVESWGDAQGFRIGGRKLRVKLIPATIHHYGWVKPPEIQQHKQKSFNRFWHTDDWVKHHVGEMAEYDYQQGGKLEPFTGSHPAVMKERIRNQNWSFRYDQKKVHKPLKERLLDGIEARCGWRIGEYQNYVII